jgi:hypothetical protein
LFSHLFSWASGPKIPPVGLCNCQFEMHRTLLEFSEKL